ncbi:glycosyltransferase family 4 protein [Thiomicrorhabdus sp.]|uniref:MraY family glycosyltransferase n=1 Tax=Thiomicrorhabdus sp. TaxID=2039724 RepID=UPI003566B699
MMFDLYYLLVALVSSLGLTYALRLYALKQNVMDIPNARSSHSVPTPRGGGVAIVLVFLAVLAFSGLWLLFIAGSLVALVGWLDDHGHVKSGIRLMVHLSGSAMVVYAVGGLPVFNLFGFEQDWGLIGDVIAVLGVAWILNLYNFMDGIDGIAGVEAATSSLVAGLILWFVFAQNEQAWLNFYLSVAVLGFLAWNWPPAKIFMGDAGSGFLGLMLGGMMLYSASIVSEMLWVWLILLGVFVVDATFTLIRRLIRGDKLYEAHRSHAYQFASRHHGGHKPVTLAVLAINLLWLSPVAYLVAIDWLDGVVGLLVSYVPLIWLAWKYNAGKAE